MLDFSSCGQVEYLLVKLILPSLRPNRAWPNSLCCRPWTSSLGGLHS